MVYAPDEAHNAEPPRASLLALAGELCGPALLMGGAHTPLGNDVRIEGIQHSWVVDCAGEMPVTYRERAGRFFIRVFPDLDGEVTALPRLRDVAAEVAIASQPGAEAPERVYVMCHHGMNRSGLVAGLILRELGVSGTEAVARILAARPGTLTTQAFRAIVES